MTRLPSCSRFPSDAYPIRAMSSFPRTIPSVNRKPAASSKSSPGVRIVTDRLRVKTPSSWGIARRISIGSSPATTSSVWSVRAPETRMTSTRALGAGRFMPPPPRARASG